MQWIFLEIQTQEGTLELGFISVKSSATLNPVLTELTQSPTVGVCFPLLFLNLTVSPSRHTFNSLAIVGRHNTKVNLDPLQMM